MKKYISAILLLIAVQAASVFAMEGWVLTTHLGASESTNSGLKLYLVDQPDVYMDAKWKGKSFHDTLYYSARLEKWKNNKANGIEWVHHKIYLVNTNDIVEKFSISDGFNQFYYNWARKYNDKTFYRFGVGVVMSHPDVSISGRERFYMKGGIGGSYLSGVTVQADLERHILENDRHFLTFDTRLTLSYIQPPISTDSNEYAELWNVALHLTLGVGSKPVPKMEGKDKLQYFLVPFGYYATVYWAEKI